MMNPSKFKNTSQFMPKQNFKFSSKLSSSQPELPIFTSGVKQHHQPQQHCANGQSNCKLNIIPEINTASANEFKALNALDLRNKNFMSQVEWSDEAYSLKNIIKYSKNPCSLSSSSIPNSYENNFPILVRVVKGSYGIIKEASSNSSNSNSSSISTSRTVQNLLLYGKTKSIFILCQSIKFNKEKKPFVFGKNISIPITYNGWFEILSEDGKSIKPLTSIRELYNHWSNSNNFKKLFQKRKNNLSYIVRENITAFIIPPSSCYYLVNSKNSFETNTNSSGDNKLYSSIELIDCKSVVIRAGDILQIDGEIYMQHTSGPIKKLIKCLVKRRLKLSHTTAEARQQDTGDPGSKQPEVLYLPEDTQGRYSPVARIENISGVHKLVDLVKKFRFPVTVQLVYGRAPPVQDTANSSYSSDENDSSHSSNSFSACANRFSPILKLLKIYEEENLFAYPVGKESCLIQLPTHTKMSMLKANNMGYLIENSSYLRSILNECKNLAPEYSDMINCLPRPPPQSILDGLDNLNTGIIQSCVKSLVGRAVLFENSSECDVRDTSNSLLHHQKKNNCSDPESTNNSCNMNNMINNNNNNNSNNNSNNNNNNMLLNNSRKSECMLIETEDENRAYDEIDRLYEYVRTGILPAEPKPSATPVATATTNKQEKLVKLKKSGSLLKLCQKNMEPQSSLPQPIRIKITNHLDNLQSKNLFLKRQQSITHLVTAGLTKTAGKDEVRLRKKTNKETPPLLVSTNVNTRNTGAINISSLNKNNNNNNNNVNSSNLSINQINQINNDVETSKELIDYYCSKANTNLASQIKRSASLNKLDSYPSTKTTNKISNGNHHQNNHHTQISSGKTTQLSNKKHMTPKLVFPIVKHTKKVNFSGINHYQQVLPPPPVIAKSSSKNIKPIELKLSDLTELANIKAIVNQNIVKTNETKQCSNGKSKTTPKFPFNNYNNNNIDNDQTYKTDYSSRKASYSIETKNKSNNLRKSEFFDSLQTLNDYDLSSSNNMPTTSSNNNNSGSRKSNHNNNNNGANMYHSFAADDLLLSSSDEDNNFAYGGEETENYYLQKSQFAPFGNAKSSLDIRGSNEKLNGVSKKKVKIYARNEYNANNKKAMNNNNVNITHGLRNYSSMEKLQIIRLQKY